LNRIRPLLLTALAGLLGGCQAVVLDPSGDVAVQQRDLLVESTALMLLVIIPVMALTVLFAWRYRQSNKDAIYEPDWDHSTHLELVIWGAPLLIIICIGAMTWMGTHLLDPYRKLARLDAGKPLSTAEPIEVDVVALDWKWLFIYPKQGIATLQQLEAPVDRPLDFRITSTTVMNSFYIPALAGQIYAMPGMETQLHAVINAPGTYQGISANYSGAGFSGMHFPFRAVSEAEFDKWVGEVKAAGGALDRASYRTLEKPTENEKPRAWGSVEADLFPAILNMCTDPGKMCLAKMSAIDAQGGLALTASEAETALNYDKTARRGAGFMPVGSQVAGLCSTDEAMMASLDLSTPAPVDAAPLIGLGLSRPTGFTE
jgi:cytochrome o ubiquinol oxidase subunit 2